MISRRPLLIPFSLSLIVALSACTGGKNVLLGSQSYRAATQDILALPDGDVPTVSLQDPHTVRLFVDRDGDLYPAPLLPVLVPDSVRARTSELVHDSVRTAKWLRGRTKSLQDVFDENPQATVWKEVRTHLQLQADASWETIQDRLFARAAAAVRDAVDDVQGPLLVLVHGYNTVDAEYSYAHARQRVAPYLGRAAVLQLHWDGLQDNSITNWKRAQFNFPQAGIALRRALLSLAPTTPVRVFTHSSGGPVAAHAFWDASATLPPDCDAPEPSYRGRRHYHEWVCTEDGIDPPQFHDLRIGMIVPATSGLLFARYNARTSPLSRLVIGANPRDEAVSKSWLIPCTVKGSTCLSVRRSLLCDDEVARLRNRDIEVLIYDFSKSSGPGGNYGWRGEDHAWTTYLERDDWPRFAAALFGDAPVSDEAHDYCR
ncbi:MAG: hypothetical protein AAFN13_06670 [Bacteroidota bacterium]